VHQTQQVQEKSAYHYKRGQQREKTSQRFDQDRPNKSGAIQGLSSNDDMCKCKFAIRGRNHVIQPYI